MTDFNPMWLLVIAVVVIALASRKKKGGKPSTPVGPDWRIGPIVNGRNYSVGMPARPTTQGQSWAFDFPTDPSQHVHYVQWFNPPSLVGKREIRIRFRVSGGGFTPQQYPDRPALVSVMIQRRGDDWGELKEAYRWFSDATVALAAGEFELIAPLSPEAWDSTLSRGTAGGFDAAMRELDNIAILFGSDGGRGHGVYATQPSRFTLLALTIA